MSEHTNGKSLAKATAQNSVLVAMAERYGMTPDAYERTVRLACGLEKLSREELAAFLLVAKDKNLNPATREIYALPKKGGGFVPVIPIDGWVHLVNDHRAMDGMEFIYHTKKGKLEAVTCRIYRKDRTRPVEVQEYLEECKRDTDPWRTMPRRMLRHKAMIQCARYAFGFSGAYDPEEAAVMAGLKDITPIEAPPPPKSSVPEKEVSPVAAAQPETTASPEASTDIEDAHIIADPMTTREVESYLDDLAGRYGVAETRHDIEDIHAEAEENAYPRMLPMDTPKAEHLYRAALERFDE